MLSTRVRVVARAATEELGTSRIFVAPLGDSGSKQTDDLSWEPARETAIIGEDPLRGGSDRECVIGRSARPENEASPDRHIGYRPELAKHEILPIDARSSRFIQPRDYSHEISGDGRFQDDDFMPPSYEHASQFL